MIVTPYRPSLLMFPEHNSFWMIASARRKLKHCIRIGVNNLGKYILGTWETSERAKVLVIK